MRQYIRRVRAVAFMAMAFSALFVGSAFATTPTSAEANTAVSEAASTATGIVTENIGVVLAVTGAWIALTFGRKLIRKVMGS